MSKIIKNADNSKLRDLMRVFNMSEVGGSTEEELQAARREAGRIVEAARTEGEAIRKRAYAEAAEKARKDMRVEFERSVVQEIRKARAAEVDALVKALDAVIAGIDQYRARLMNESREQLVALAVRIARSVVKREVNCAADVARLNLEEAIRLSAKHTQLVVRVSRQDVETLKNVLGEIDALKRSDSVVELVPSDEIMPGGCLVETACGEVDARIETQLREIEKALLGDAADA